MTILSHRGYWKIPEEKNTTTAFQRSFALGFGTETDVRDRDGRLVIAHDLPDADSIAADKCFAILAAQNPRLPLAINVKSDGLQALLTQVIELHGLQNYFLFDMSVPDAIQSLRVGLRCFTRHSEYETRPAFYDQAVGVWMDGFETDWITAEAIRDHLDSGKQVCLVSPELHRREHRGMWDRLAAASDLLEHPHLMLCSDFPENARDYLQLCPKLER